MDVATALKSCVLFKGFTDTGIQIFAGVCAPKQFPPGTPLFVENMVADSMLIVAIGTVALSTKGRHGEDVSLGEVGPGDVLGEMSLMQPGQRLCSAVARTPVVALEVRQTEFHKLLASKPQACVKLLMAVMALFGQKLAENRDALKSLAGRV